MGTITHKLLVAYRLDGLKYVYTWKSKDPNIKWHQWYDKQSNILSSGYSYTKVVGCV